MQRGRKFYAFSASTPGNALPSIHSRKAPPAVETKVKSPATPAWLSAATVSPPPATEVSEPSRVSAAAVLASATVAVSKGGVSNAQSGQLHNKVRHFLSRSPERRAGKECEVRVDIGGRRCINKKKNR